ncbi:hypothetical protein FOZ61_006189 [Perkinsus olseni]|uniref:DDE Tnp4 domain-containing protein n=1 Tax=Perkinsus olseni TaxID=32597 RepID=A0A7J6MAD5_PEROL|nr:hypothetical protein FOZ61_006189 [Perkinsus olseni]KAF4674066.1 hypothetical protein FOL46_005927 [Perkinsus olseni]
MAVEGYCTCDKREKQEAATLTDTIERIDAQTQTSHEDHIGVQAAEEVVEAIVVHRNYFIRFPSNATIASGDADVDPRLPNCIGLLDGTHVLLKDVVPSAERADYVDSKRHISLNVQALLGAGGRWISVSTSNVGSAHDARVYQSSLLSRRVRTIPHGYWICGDSAYGLASTLYTPYANPQANSPEAAFNVAHKSVRSAIERRFRKLKRSWAICDGRLRLKPVVKCAKAALACFCLHNFQLMMQEPEEDDEEDERDNDEDAVGDRGVDVGAEALLGLESRAAYVAAQFAA